MIKTVHLSWSHNQDTDFFVSEKLLLKKSQNMKILLAQDPVAKH